MIALPPLCSTLYVLLHTLDAAVATAVRSAGCQLCGGRLDRSAYPRKPRGLPAGVDTEIKRLSFCCAVEGCRKRHTPPSVQFLGRKVYVAPVLVLCCMGRRGPTRHVVRRLHALFGVDPRTLHRWRTLWQLEVPQTDWWHHGRGLLPATLDVSRLPGALLQQFGGLGALQTWTALLQFLQPLTTRRVRVP